MKNIRTVIWDCDSVMWFHRPDESHIIADALNIKDIKQLEIEFYSMLSYINSYFIDKKVTLKETYKIIERKMPILYFHQISPKRFMKVWNSISLKINEFNTDTPVVMKYLQENGIKQIIKSDWWRETQEIMLKEFGLIHYIEELHCCDCQYIKSNPLSAKGIIKPGKEKHYIIIGDSLKSDIAFANHAGIKSIWFNHKGEKENDTEYQPTFEVHSLLEIKKII